MSTREAFKCALDSFLEIAQLLILMGDRDQEYSDRFTRLATIIQSCPRGVQDNFLLDVYDALCDIGYDQIRADQITDELAGILRRDGNEKKLAGSWRD